MVARAGNPTEPNTAEDGLPKPQRYWAILTLMVGLAMSCLDTAIVNVALPVIAKDLHTSAADLMSVNTALVRFTYPRRQLGRGIALVSFVVAVSSAAGPSVAAAILAVASWPWLFAINVPIGIVTLLLSFRYLPYTAPSEHRFDL